MIRGEFATNLIKVRSLHCPWHPVGKKNLRELYQRASNLKGTFKLGKERLCTQIMVQRLCVYVWMHLCMCVFMLWLCDGNRSVKERLPGVLLGLEEGTAERCFLKNKRMTDFLSFQDCQIKQGQFKRKARTLESNKPDLNSSFAT